MWLKWGLRGCEILAAAIVLLLLTQLHTAIVRNAFTMVGARTDVPLIVGIEDGCQTQLVPLAWRVVTKESGAVKVCSSDVRVITTVPPGQGFVLLLNDVPVVGPPTRAPLFKFPSLRLRPGNNRLIVIDPTARVEFPLVSLSRYPDIDAIRPGFAIWLTPLGEVPMVETSYLTQVMLDTPTQEQRREGPYASADGSKWLLVQGRPGDAMQMRPGERFDGDRIGSDGFGILRLRSDAPELPEGRDLAWHRELTLRRSKEQGIEASLNACLAPDHPLVAWSREGLIDAPELILRLTGVVVSEYLVLAEGLRRERSLVTIPQQQEDPSCVRLEAQYGVSSGFIRQLGFNNWFLLLKGDRLILEGLSRDVVTQGRPADERVADRMIWRGTMDTDRRPPTLLAIPIMRPRPVSSSVSVQDQPELATAQRQGLLERWRNLADALPTIFQQLLWGIAVAAPVALIYWALGRHLPDSPRPLRIARARAGLLALLAFMIALALHPLLLELSRSVVAVANLWPFLVDDGRFDRLINISYAPVAFVVVLVILRLLPRYSATPTRHGRGWVRALAALASLALVAAALVVSLLERQIAIEPDIVAAFDDWLGLNGWVADRAFVSAQAIGGLVLAWCLVGLLFFWIPVFWLARSTVRWGPLVGPALFAAALAFFVPLISPATEVLRILLAASSRSYDGFGVGSALLSAFVAVTSVASVIIMVSLVLCGFREIAASMLDPVSKLRLRAWTRWFVLVVVAILIVGPTTAAFASPETANLRLLQLMTIFQAYAALIAVIAPLTAMRYLDASRQDGDFQTKFRLDVSVVLLLTVAFAGYLTYWLHEPIGVLILIVIGWLTFADGVLDPHPAIANEPEHGLAKRILAYRAETALIAARRKTVEREFTDDKIEEWVLAGKRAPLAVQAERAQAALAMPVEEAKRGLLGFGPGPSPLANGFLGASAGLVAAALFQIVLRLDFKSGAAAQAPSWLTVLFVDSNYKPVSTSDVSPVLALVSELLNAFTIWVLVGFLFGYSFHRIRGKDGFTKAIVFGTGIAVTFLVSQALIARGAGVPLERLASFLPIFVFLIILGSLVFDGKSVKRQGVPLGQLPDIYGLKVSIAYASFAGVIAAIQPLLQFFGWIFKK